MKKEGMHNVHTQGFGFGCTGLGLGLIGEVFALLLLCCWAGGGNMTCFRPGEWGRGGLVSVSFLMSVHELVRTLQHDD